MRGANPLHAEAAKRNVASGKAKYAIYDEGTRKLYVLSCGAISGQPSAISEEWKNLDQSCVEQYLGQRVRISGRLTPAPITRAGQSFAPDAVAAPKDAAGNADQSSVARIVSADPAAATDPSRPDATNAVGAANTNPARIQSHPMTTLGAGSGSRRAVDTSTPVAGILIISTVEVLTTAPPVRRTSAAAADGATTP
jgi:hypothetical protein